MAAGTIDASLQNVDGGTLTNADSGTLLDEGDTVFGHPIPRAPDDGAALTNADDGTLLDPKTGAVLVSEGIGIIAGRTTFYLNAGFNTVAGQDFVIHSGDSAQIVVTLADVDGSQFDASQATITWTAGKIGTPPAISKSSAEARQIRKPGKAHYIAIIYLTADDLVLPTGTDLGALYQHELKITTVDLQTVTAMTGIVTIIRSLA